MSGEYNTYNLNPRVRKRPLIDRSMTGISLKIAHARVNVTHLDGGHRVDSRVDDAVGVLYPGERVDFNLEWPEAYYETASELTIYLDKE